MATATAQALRAHAQGESSAFPPDFNRLVEDYAAFCGKLPDERMFYALKDGKIVQIKLDNASWHPAEWGEPPALPVPGGSWDGVPMNSPIPDLAGDGPYKPTWDSMQQYDAPEWYRDAKFGIWAHWSPQCVPEAGDWYARAMYQEGSKDYKYHLEHYSPQSRFGYKDLCPQWTLLNWEPEELISRYKKAGARLFIALANHHDGFDTWDSKHQPWNAAALGPHRDVVGTWAAAARKQDMRFGVTVHQARNWWWFQPSHGADTSGPYSGVPYDGDLRMNEGKDQWWQGLDPHRVYGVKHPKDALPDTSYVKNFYDRTRDLIDQHNPDLLYFDNSLVPLGWAGMNIAAYFYNHNLATHGGKMEAVLNGKQVPDRLAKTLIADYERGLTDKIMEYAWQSETCIGEWHYNRALYEKDGEYGGYLPPRDVIHWMIDTVSKNGTFILNVPGKPDGTIDSKEIAVLDGVTAWMQVNGEAIYETRPWKIYGEGPHAVKSGSFQGNSISALGSEDVRFTRNKANTVVYALVLGWPTKPVVVRALGTSAATNPGKIAHVELIGTEQKLKWKQSADSLRVELPDRYRPASDYAAALKVTLA
ncbi:MAG TPA: alpha-L-fucosidase [Terracidiphilus sp.]|jgi:alpha-L-fucosidase|nr:alpha-L-fucosidase [Terracidiphilus sp.]